MNNIGWICARCSKSNAPHINSCDCSVATAPTVVPYPIFIPYTVPVPIPPTILPYPNFYWDYTITCTDTAINQNPSVFVHNETLT